VSDLNGVLRAGSRCGSRKPYSVSRRNPPPSGGGGRQTPRAELVSSVGRAGFALPRVLLAVQGSPQYARSIFVVRPLRGREVPG